MGHEHSFLLNSTYLELLKQAKYIMRNKLFEQKKTGNSALHVLLDKLNNVIYIHSVTDVK